MEQFIAISLCLGQFFFNLKQLITKGLFTWREPEDPRRWIIIAPYVFCILAVNMLKVVLVPSTRILLAPRYEDLSTRTNQTKMVAGG